MTKELLIPDRSTRDLSAILTGDLEPDIPSRIDLGIFGYEAEQLQSLTESNRCEYATCVAKDGSSKLYFSQRTVKGDYESVELRKHTAQ